MQESKNLFLLNLCFLSKFSCSFFPFLFLNQFLSSFLSSFFLSCSSLSVFFLSSLLSFLPLTLSSFLVCFLLYLSIVSVHLFIVSYGQKCSNTRSSICCQLWQEWQEGDRLLTVFLHLCFSSLVTGNTEQFDNLGEKDLRKKIL